MIGPHSMTAAVALPTPPECYRPLIPNQKRRALWHDYRSICNYLLTFAKGHGIPPFSRVEGRWVNSGSPATGGVTPPGTMMAGTSVAGTGGAGAAVAVPPVAEAWVVVSKIGYAIECAVAQFERQYPAVSVGSMVIMPDHVHMVVRVKKYLDKPLGWYISKFLGMCSRMTWQESPALKGVSIFEEGFNDRILLQREQWDKWDAYILDNPRRLWLRFATPHFFQRGVIAWPLRSPGYGPAEVPDSNGCAEGVMAQSVWAEGRVRELPTYGNSQLLSYPLRQVVRFRRCYDVVTWQGICDGYLRTALQGGVLISPFIHAEEKRLREKILASGGRIIHVTEYPYEPRQKPARSDFDLCAEGRLLFAARTCAGCPGGTRRVYSRATCMSLNAMSAWLAATPGISRHHRLGWPSAWR